MLLMSLLLMLILVHLRLRKVQGPDVEFVNVAFVVTDTVDVEVADVVALLLLCFQATKHWRTVFSSTKSS